MVTGCPGVHSILSIVSRGVLMMMEIASILPSFPAWWLVTMLPAINGHHISHAHVTLHDQNNLAHLHLHSYRHPVRADWQWMPIKCHVFYCCIFIRKNNSNQNIFSADSILGVLNWLPPVFVLLCRVPGDGEGRHQDYSGAQRRIFLYFGRVQQLLLHSWSGGNQLTGHWTPAVTLLPS